MCDVSSRLAWDSFPVETPTRPISTWARLTPCEVPGQRAVVNAGGRILARLHRGSGARSRPLKPSLGDHPLPTQVGLATI